MGGVAARHRRAGCPARLANVRLRPLRPTQHQWADTQPVGERLWREGAAGILAPSAAHMHHAVLTVFRTGPDVPGVAEAGPVTVHGEIPRIPTGLRT